MTFYRGLFYGSLFAGAFWAWLALVVLAIKWEGGV